MTSVRMRESCGRPSVLFDQASRSAHPPHQSNLSQYHRHAYHISSHSPRHSPSGLFFVPSSAVLSLATSYTMAVSSISRTALRRAMANPSSSIAFNAARTYATQTKVSYSCGG